MGQVVESHHPLLRAGDYVVTPLGWREGFVSNGRGLQVVDASLAPVQAYLGVLGMPGCPPMSGCLAAESRRPRTPASSPCGGRVGSAACQIARSRAAG